MNNSKLYKFTVKLSGSAKDRRQKFKALQKQYPDYDIVLRAPHVMKSLDGYNTRVEVEEANKAKSYAILTKRDGGTINTTVNEDVPKTEKYTGPKLQSTL